MVRHSNSGRLPLHCDDVMTSVMAATAGKDRRYETGRRSGGQSVLIHLNVQLLRMANGQLFKAAVQPAPEVQRCQGTIRTPGFRNPQ
jgi:DnaJ-class molecular chaperone